MLKHTAIKSSFVIRLTGEEINPDEKLMRSIEEQIGISENAKKAFREEILIRISAYASKGKRFDYNSHERFVKRFRKNYLLI